MSRFIDGFKMKLDIEVYDKFGEGYWAQCRYLVHGYDDVLWTNDLEDALNYIRHDLYKAES